MANSWLQLVITLCPHDVLTSAVARKVQALEGAPESVLPWYMALYSLMLTERDSSH